MAMMYELARGPLVWVAFVVFFCGCLYQFVSKMRLAKKDKVVYGYMNAKYGLRSIAHWIIPYANSSTRTRPVFAFFSFLFHFCLLATPIFALGHVLSWQESWRIRWWSLPAQLGNLMTVAVISIGVLFALRRMVDPVVRYVSSTSDYLLLAVVLAPFVTGLLAHYRISDYKTMITLHICTGALWLMAIPFTRLVHMLFFPFTRAYMGSEFGFVRRARDW
jgi:nitrate reductase gamma subunit